MSRPRPIEGGPAQDASTETTSTGARPKRALDGSPTASGTRRAVGFGKYRLFARLGSGGMADVYLAVAHGAMNVNRLVVIKRLRDEHASDAGSREMFLNEARLAARLNHPNVIQTFEAGSENGSFFLAMEYVDGQPLSRVLTAFKRQGKLLEPRIAARICSDALSGLHYAHELCDFDGTPLEIVHRDVSPQNVMLTYEGAVKLVDFGIAKAVGTAQTAHGVFKGKVAFMAPEQVRGDNVNRRADLFAMGIVLWESVTGRHLMAESTPAATLYNLMTKEIPRASSVNPDVPAALDDIIERSLRRNVDERYQTAKAMREDLEAFINHAGGVTPDEIGALTKALFTETREKVQAQIKAQLATLSFGKVTLNGTQTAGELSQSLSLTQVRQMANGLVALDDGFAEASSKASVFRVVTTTGEVPATTRRMALVAWFCIPLLALAASGLALMRSQRAPNAEEAAASQPPPPTTVIELVPTPVPVAAPPVPAAAETATASARVQAVTARPQVVTAPPPPRPVWTPPPRPSPPPAPQATPATQSESSKSAPPSAAQPKPQETSQGRTFRRDL